MEKVKVVRAHRLLHKGRRKTGELHPEEKAALEIQLEIEQADREEFDRCAIDLDLLMTRVMGHLMELTEDIELTKTPAQNSIQWLISHSADLLTFLVGPWYIMEDGLHRDRGNSFQPRPRIPAEQTRLRCIMFQKPLLALLLALEKPSMIMKLSDEGRLELRQAIGHAYLDQLKSAYTASELNPVFAWEAYALSEQLGWQPPLWVSDYLARCARKLVSLIMRHDDRTNREIPSVFGLGGKKGSGRAMLSNAQRWSRDNQIFATMYNRRNAEGGWDGPTMAAICEKHFCTADVARRVYPKKLAELGFPPKPKKLTKGRLK